MLSRLSAVRFCGKQTSSAAAFSSIQSTLLFKNVVPAIFQSQSSTLFTTQNKSNRLARIPTFKTSIPAPTSEQVQFLRQFSAVAAAADASSSDSHNHSKSSAVTTHQSHKTNAKHAEATSGPSSLSDVLAPIGGMYPIVGLGLVAAVAKEWLILDAELLLSTNFFTVLFLGYLFAAEPLIKWCAVDYSQAEKQIKDFFGVKLLLKSIDADRLKFQIGQEQLYKDVAGEYQRVLKAVSHAREMKAKKAITDGALKRLSDAVQRQEAEQQAYLTNVYDSATNYVKTQFVKLPAQSKNVYIDHAIALIGQSSKGTMSASSDPVKKLYTDYLQGQMYKKDLKK